MNLKNKIYINALFALLCVLMLVFVLWQKDSYQSDIYALFDIKLNADEQRLIEQSKAKLSLEFLALSDDFTLLQDFEKLATQSKIFEKIQLNLQDSNTSLSEISQLKLATFNNFKNYLGKDFNTSKKLLQQGIEALFSPFSIRFDTMQNDFLNISAYSSLLHKNHFQIELEKSALFVQENDKKYYFAKATLKKEFDRKALIKLIETLEKKAEIQKATLYFHSGAIFEAKAKLEGEKEGIVMGFLSLCLLGLLVFFAFGKWRFLRLLFIVAFSFLGGLSGALFCFDKVHFLSLVISTSLIGLVLDFSLHYIASNSKDKKEIFKIFLIGFVITSSGYALFLFANSLFLKQIAIISIFALFSSFVATYFWLPYLLKNDDLVPKKLFRICLYFYLYFLRKIRFKFLFIFALLLCLIFLSFIKNLHFSDDIKSYSHLDEKALSQSKKVLELLHFDTQTNLLLMSGNLDDEARLINALKEKNLIQDYEGLSKYFLSIQRQNELKNALISLLESKETLKFYTPFGFDENALEKFANAYKKIPILSEKELLQNPLVKDLEHFLFDENLRVLSLKNPTINDEFFTLLSAHKASFMNFNHILNQSINTIKYQAFILKLIGFALAFVVLFAFFGVKKAALFCAFILFALCFTLDILLLLGQELNIFVLFGLILASAVGVDYFIFAQNTKLSRSKRVLSIVLCAVTSIISFAFLSLSKTPAVANFGLSVSLSLACLAFISSFYATKTKI